MGTKIIETGSTAGGTAKVEYKDEAGNVLWYYDDTGNFVRNGNAKITGLAGTGTRMVTADASGNLSASLPDYAFAVPLSTTPTNTNISINGGFGGKTIMLYFSAHWDAGNSTSSGIYMIRCGHDGNNYSVVKIAFSGDYAPVFSQVGGYLYIGFPTPAHGSIRVTANN